MKQISVLGHAGNMEAGAIPARVGEGAAACAGRGCSGAYHKACAINNIFSGLSAFLMVNVGLSPHCSPPPFNPFSTSFLNRMNRNCLCGDLPPQKTWIITSHLVEHF